jgi:RimJ/RimL family protein N-acetyltransferase
MKYYNLDEEACSAYAGICLPEEDTWGRRYSSETSWLLVEHLLGEMGLGEVGVATWMGNRRMVACALKCGFHEIGRMPHRTSSSVRGEPLERVEFSLSQSE